MRRFCLKCKKRRVYGSKKYCSHRCYSLLQKGIRKSPKTEFKEGHLGYWFGKRRSKETIRKISKATKGRRPWNKGLKGVQENEKAPGWKGDGVSYSGLHYWVNRKLGKPQRCEICGKEKKLQWANKSHEYKRELSDWFPLCVWCHRAYDMELGWGKATKKYKEISYKEVQRRRDLVNEYYQKEIRRQ